MKQLDYKSALNFCAEEAVAALYWCENPKVLVDKENHEVDWLDTETKKTQLARAIKVIGPQKEYLIIVPISKVQE